MYIFEQVIFPRSKNKRIQKKWAKNAANYKKIKTNNGSFHFNFVYVIQSLNPNEFEPATGLELYNKIIKPESIKSKIEADFSDCRKKSEFIARLEFIKNKSVMNRGHLPLIHIEAHGNEFGIILASGEVLQWADIGNILSSINYATKCNLFLGMAICSGAGVIAFINKITPPIFFAAFAPVERLYGWDLYQGYELFYKELFSSLSIDRACHKVSSSKVGHLFEFDTIELILQRAIIKVRANHVNIENQDVAKKIFLKKADELLLLSDFPENRQRFSHVIEGILSF